jgi:hypothetical protein
MNKARYIFAASAVFLSAALAANTFSNNSITEPVSSPSPTIAIPANLKDSDVLTWDCEIPVQKPDTITLTCADGGWIVHTITWSKWGIDGAKGTGIFREKLCDPSCAEGDIAQEKVKVELSDLAEREGEFYLRTLDIRTASGKDFISGRSNGLEWDVMEYIEQMNWVSNNE